MTERDPVFGCELWLGTRDKDGYGVNENRGAHIVAWERANGRVAEGLDLDHLCRRRNCVALAHLEPVTRQQNEWRKKWSHRSRRAACAKGHDLQLTAMITPEGGRVCRLCSRATVLT